MDAEKRVQELERLLDYVGRYTNDEWAKNYIKYRLTAHVSEFEAIRSALQSARLGARLRGITTREFAAMCAVSPCVLSGWTSDIPDREPDFKD